MRVALAEKEPAWGDHGRDWERADLHLPHVRGSPLLTGAKDL